MNDQAEHSYVDHTLHLPRNAVLVPVVLAITIGLFYAWFLVTGSVLGAVADIPLEFVLPALVLPMLAAYIFSRNERLWAFLALGTLAVFIFREDDGKLKLEELLYSVFVLSGIAIWFVKEVAVHRLRIVRTSFDFFFLSSWVLTNAVATVAFLTHGGNGLIFIKELLIHVTFLLYFPLRNVVQNRRHLLTMIGILVGLAMLNGAYSVLTYQQRVIESALEFGFVAARVASSEGLSMILALISFTLLAYARKPITFLAGAAGTAAGIAFVVMSLSRGPIASTAVGMLVVIALVPVKKGIKLVVSIGAIIAFNIAALLFVVPTFGASILDNISDRFATIDKIQVDKSFGSRVAESEALLENYIPASPMIGYGYGVPYSYYDVPFSMTARVYFIHNGYVYPFYKFGIPVGLFFLFMLFYPLMKGVYVHPPRDSGFPRAVMTGTTACLIAILVTNLTSCKFAVYVDTGLFVVVFVAFDYVWRTMPATTRNLAVVKA